MHVHVWIAKKPLPPPLVQNYDNKARRNCRTFGTRTSLSALSMPEFNGNHYSTRILFDVVQEETE